MADPSYLDDLTPEERAFIQSKDGPASSEVFPLGHNQSVAFSPDANRAPTDRAPQYVPPASKSGGVPAEAPTPEAKATAAPPNKSWGTGHMIAQAFSGQKPATPDQQDDMASREIVRRYGLPTKKAALARVTGKPTPPPAADNTATAPTSPVVDPVADMDKRVAADKAALAAAQSDANSKLQDAYNSNRIWAAQAHLSGRPVDQDAANARLALAGKPLEDYQQQRAAETQGLTDATKRNDLVQESRLDNPADPAAKAAAALAVAKGMMPPSAANGFTLRTWSYMAKGADFAQAKAKADQEDVTKRRGQDMELQGKLAVANKSANETASGRSAVILKNLAAKDSEIQALDAQYQQAKRTGILPHWVSKVPGVGGLLAPGATSTTANASTLKGPEGAKLTPEQQNIMSGGAPGALESTYRSMRTRLQQERDAIRAEMTGGALRHGSQSDIDDMLGGGGASNTAIPRAGDSRINPQTGKREYWVPQPR